MGLPTNPDDPTGGGAVGGGGGGGSPPPASDYGPVVLTRTITKKDADSALDVMVYLNCAAVDDLRFTVYLLLDGAMIQLGTFNLIFDNNPSSAQGTVAMPVIQDGVGAGDHTLEVRVKNRDHAPLSIIPGSMIKVTEIRAAAR